MPLKGNYLGIRDVVKGRQVTKTLPDNEQDRMTTSLTIVGARTVVIIVNVRGIIIDVAEDKVGD